MAAILAVQALFFADGGLLALGCNIFNMGFFSCLVAYPFIYRPLAGKHPGTGRITLSSITAAVIGLQMGAFAVVLETTASGISALPFAQFVELMLPIHLAIGAVEGLATAAVVIFISKAQPSLLRPADLETGTVKKASWTVLGIFAVAALLCGAALSWFASAYPDGLEWSVAGVTGSEETSLAEPSPLHRNLETVQEATAIMPNYAFPANDGANTAETEASSSIVNPETSMAGVLGSVIIAALIFAAGFLFGRKPHSRCPRCPSPCHCLRTPRGNSARWIGFPAEIPVSTVWTPALKSELSSSIKSAFFPGLRRKSQGSCLSSCSRSASSAWRAFPWATF